MYHLSRHIGLRGLRLGGFIFMLLMTLLMPITTLAAGPAIVREELNLRSGPGLGYAVVSVMPAGSAVRVTGDPSEGWFPVRYNAIDGWAYAEYIDLDGQAQGAAATTGSTDIRGAATVVTSLLNLRGGPGTTYSVVAQLPYGTTVEITGDPRAGDGHTWIEVSARGYGQGWVAAEFLSAGEAPRSAPASDPIPEPAVAPASSGDSIVDIITAAANRYGQSPSAMLAVARCESNLDPSAFNPRSNASGLFQFLPGTWRTTPYASSSIFDPYANANAAAWMWSVGRRGEWVC